MTTAQFPSSDFPAYPEIAIDCPEGWSPMPDAGVEIAIGRDTPPDEFRPNVVVAVTRRGRDATLGDAVGHAVQTLTVAEGWEELGREETEVAGFPGFRIEGAFRHPRAGTVAQAVRLAWVDRGPVADLVQITGSCNAEQADELWGAIRDIQDSLSVTVDQVS